MSNDNFATAVVEFEFASHRPHQNWDMCAAAPVVVLLKYRMFGNVLSGNCKTRQRNTNFKSIRSEEPLDGYKSSLLGCNQYNYTIITATATGVKVLSEIR